MQLGRKVPIVDFKPQGWKLQSASFCEVHKLASVQFHFTRNGGKQHITVLSMPASAWANAKDGSRYELSADGHPIAGFIRSGSLNCVVGDTALSSGDAVILRDAMRTDSSVLLLLPFSQYNVQESLSGSRCANARA